MEIASHVFERIIQTEFDEGRHLSPSLAKCSNMRLGHFSILPAITRPKSGKPGKYYLIQNLLYPYTNQLAGSINAHREPDDYPRT